MNTRIYSKRGFEQKVNNAVALAYERTSSFYFQ